MTPTAAACGGRRRHFETCATAAIEENDATLQVLAVPPAFARGAPKAGPGEDEKTRRTREPDFPTRATRVYASVEEARGPGDTSQRCTGRLSGRISSTSPDVPSPSAADGSRSRPRTTRRRALEVRPGPTRLGENEKRQSITARASKPKKTKRARVVKLDLSHVDDDTPVTIDGSSSSEDVDVDDRVAPTDSEESTSWAEAFSDEPRWSEGDETDVAPSVGRAESAA